MRISTSDGDDVTLMKIKQGRREGLVTGAGETYSINRMANKGFTQEVISKQNQKQTRKPWGRGYCKERVQQVGGLWGMACAVSVCTRARVHRGQYRVRRVRVTEGEVREGAGQTI